MLYSEFFGNCTAANQVAGERFQIYWAEEQQNAFETLKRLFTEAPVLRIPDPTLQFIVETDASNFALDAILSQRIPSDNNRLHPCAYYSMSMNPADRNYDIGDKELLAVKAAFEEWRHYLEGAQHPVIVYTEHQNLLELHKEKYL